MEEELLTGGNTHGQVVRVGHTIRRPTGFWTPSVHALLSHLQDRGFTGSPRVHGLDEQAREVLDYVDGLIVWPDHFALVESDSAFAEVAALIRNFHDAAASFDLFDRHAWSDRGADPVGPYEILCHNDLAPWNLVRGNGGDWTFIDWDLAAPGRRSWDIAWALLSFAPLMPDRGLEDARIADRIAVFVDAYGADQFPVDVLAVAVERCEYEAERIERLGASGEAPYAQLLADGHAEVWHGAATHITARGHSWRTGFSR